MYRSGKSIVITGVRQVGGRGCTESNESARRRIVQQHRSAQLVLTHLGVRNRSVSVAEESSELHILCQWTRNGVPSNVHYQVLHHQSHGVQLTLGLGRRSESIQKSIPIRRRGRRLEKDASCAAVLYGDVVQPIWSPLDFDPSAIRIEEIRQMQGSDDGGVV